MLDPQGRPHGTPLDDVLHLWSLPFGALPLSSSSSAILFSATFALAAVKGLGGICGKCCSIFQTAANSSCLLPLPLWAPLSFGSSRLICLPTQCQLLWQLVRVLQVSISSVAVPSYISKISHAFGPNLAAPLALARPAP